MSNSRNVQLWSATALLLVGCATVAVGTSQNIFVDTPEVEGAECELSDSKGGHWYLPRTPGTITVKKGDGPMTVTCRKDGYEYRTVTINETLSGAVFGNILIGGVIGVVVDGVSGAAQRYPDKLVVWLKPSAFDSKEEEAAWERRRGNYERMFEEPAPATAATAAAPAARVVDPSQRARIMAYMDSNKFRFERAMLDFDISNMHAFNARPERLSRPRIQSYDVREANEKRIVLRVVFIVGQAHEARPHAKLLLVHWVDENLEIIAQRDAPRLDVADW